MIIDLVSKHYLNLNDHNIYKSIGIYDWFVRDTGTVGLIKISSLDWTWSTLVTWSAPGTRVPCPQWQCPVGPMWTSVRGTFKTISMSKSCSLTFFKCFKWAKQQLAWNRSNNQHIILLEHSIPQLIQICVWVSENWGCNIAILQYI